ncbi:zf-PARP domain-containing protein [Phanerochaete sordida]|uniref:Zf-PARP domain-containing protein n=1 Tax=Phanerochaete sordida TaxID=48140 RepID=A0A9P3L9Z8_9APHY|nr:zf-PARP domain-containing protein [Phanerochaete sordida]
MSDNEEGGKKSGYRLEYAGSARAKCKGPKPCAGTPIPKGALRMGSVVDFKGNTSFAWRHWGCVTSKVLQNMKTQFEDPEDLDGFEDLEDEDKARIRKAYQDGHVADEDIPESARKPAADDMDEDEDGEKPKKKAAAKGKKAKDDGPLKFKLEYASAGRAKCKDGCGETISKDFFRLGHEVDFRGNKSFSFQHWGCASDDTIAKLKASYGKPEEIEGFSEIKEAEQEKVKRAWEEGAIPEDDKGPGEPVATEKKKKAPAKRAKKDDDGDDGEKPAKKRARKAKKAEDDDEDEDEEEKPKPKRAAPKKAPAKEKAPPKKRASKKKQDSDDDDDLEDFTAAIDAVGGDEDEDEEDEPKPKRKPASKPASKKASAPPSKSKPASKPVSRKKKQEAFEEEDEYDD